MTDLATEINKLSKRIPTVVPVLKTEEATKNALVMPFIEALGYNVSDPFVVIPEFVADHGIKSGEKVDYAIAVNGVIQIIIECKTVGTDLDKEGGSQLYRYFSVTEAKIGILTNGVEYRFFTDLEEKNRVDRTPFFVVSLDDLKPNHIVELEKYQFDCFQIEDILNSAEYLKYYSLVVQKIGEELSEPSEDFVRLMAKGVYPGRFTNSVKDWFTGIVTEAAKHTLRDMVNKRLATALEANSGGKKEQEEEDIEGDPPVREVRDNSGIVTTEEETEAYQIVRAILREKVSVDKIVLRDLTRSCNVLFEGNQRKPICKFYLDRKRKHIAFGADPTRHEIESVDQIFGYSDNLKEALEAYL